MSRCPSCEKEARVAAAERRSKGEVEGQPDRNGRVVAFSEEERKRRSELAKRLHAEGRFGGAVIGARGGMGVSRHRISDAVLEHFRQPENQELIVNAYRSALKGKNKHLRVRAADSLMKVDKDTAERERADRGGAIDPSGMTYEELKAFVAQGVQAMIEQSPDVITLDDDDVQDLSLIHI